jgi:hypothetical protein
LFVRKQEFLSGFMLMHLSLPGVMLWLRVTARISAVLVVCAFAAPALARLWPSALSQWMASNRHRFTLLFALSHTLHLAGIVMLAALIPAQFVTKRGLLVQIPGASVYVLIYFLAYMAFTRRKNPELANTKMQTFGLYLLWGIFTLAFTTGVWRNAWIYVPLAAMMWLALAVRISARMSRTLGVQMAQ